MIVRCLRIIDALGHELDEHPSMSVGTSYTVLEITCSPGQDPLLRVHNKRYHSDENYPGLWRSEMFEVLDPSIPSNWEVAIGGAANAGYIHIAPATWQRPGFWEDLEDWSPLSERAIQDYKKELAIILDEAGRKERG